jgi:hypothetical protein
MISYSVTQCGFVDGFQHFGDIRCIFYAEVERAILSETLIPSTKLTASFARKNDCLLLWAMHS